MNNKRHRLSTSRMTRGLAVILAVTLMAMMPLNRVSADADDLDTSFGTNGFVITPSEVNIHLYDAATQADGKIIAAGCSGTSPNLEVTLIRYNANGSLDTTFGTAGMVKTDFFDFYDCARAIALQTDGKIVIGGTVHLAANNNAISLLARYNYNGTLDTTFGSGGKVTNDQMSQATDIAIQANGRIVIVGQDVAMPVDDRNFVVMRYHANGSLDTSFGGDGIVETDFDGNSATAWSVAIQSNNRILVGGSEGALLGSRFAMARYNPDGSLDSAFGVAGKVTADLAGTHDSAAEKIALLPDGRILLAGRADHETNWTIGLAVARFYANGNLDTTFGVSGGATTFFTEDHITACGGIEVLANGKIVLGGTFSSAEGLVITRYNANGTADTQFGDNGQVITDFPDAAIRPRGITLFGYDQIIGFGRVTGDTPDSPSGSALVRYQGDGVLRRADLSVAMSSAITQNTSGERFIQYTITVTNNGHDEARYVTLSARTPSSTTYYSLKTPSGWARNTPTVGAAGSVQTSKTAMAFGESATFILVVKVNPSTAPGTLIRCTADVSTAMRNDPGSSNNRATVQTTWN